MRVILAGAALALVMVGSAAAQGSHYVRGYFRADGTYVQPHHQTDPDDSRFNNYSTAPNVNPYTGEQGRERPYQAFTPYEPPRQQPQQNTYEPPFVDAPRANPPNPDRRSGYRPY